MLLIAKDTMKIRVTAPTNAGITLNPPITGPNSRFGNNEDPIHEPTKPATILPMMPPGTSLPKKAPAIAPMIPPTIKDHIKLISIPPSFDRSIATV